MSIYTSIIQKILANKTPNVKIQAHTIASLEWYRTKMMRHFGETRLVVDQSSGKAPPKKITKINPGWIYSYTYSPKGKAELPYYDMFPLVLVLHTVPGGFIGLNLHYLRPIDRAIFMDKLYQFEIPDKKNNTMRINITYPTLEASKRLDYYKACIKRYRYYNIGSFFVAVTPEEWDQVLFLPTENFKKEPKKTVWKISRSKY